MVIVDTVYLNEGEIVVNEDVFESLLSEINKLKQLIKEVEEELDEYNCMNGEKYEYCKFCNSIVYKGLGGIAHQENCIITKLREFIKLKND